jgi:RNA polymerase sigma-70 factor (ECF subfamily)
MAYSLAYRITGDASLAEDAVQEAFLAAWRNASRYAAGRGSVKTWLLTIVHRRAVDIVRRRRRPTESLTEETQAPELGRQDIWTEVAHGLDRAAVVQAVNDLPDAQRVAIELVYFGGLTHVELSAATGAPLGTVKTRVRAGLESLRRTLRPCGDQGASSQCVRPHGDHCAL